MMRIFIVRSILLVLTSCLYITAVDLTVRTTPFVAVPVGSEAQSLFSVGGAVNAVVGSEFFDFITIGPEIGYFVAPLQNTGTFPSFLATGISTGFHFYPISRLRTGVSVSGGVYQFRHHDRSYSDLWAKTQGDVGFRISPSLSLGLSAGYVYFAATDKALYTGMLLGLGLQYTFARGSGGRGITADVHPHEPVFPLFYRVYAATSIGTITIHNRETAEIRNVSVHFRAGNFSASSTPTGSTPLLRRNGSISFPLYAEFSPRLQDLTEDGVIRGELEIRYELLGTDRLFNQTVTIPVHNRNTFRWTDNAALVAFISANSPEVMHFSKYIVGLARNHLRSGLNRNMQFALFLMEGLIAGGMRYSNDARTSYLEFRNEPEKLDFIQFPFQTLSFRMGDYDDLGLLYAAVLESVGIRTALIPLKNDFIVAYSLNIDARQAEGLFHDTSRLLTIQNEIWMPLSLATFREGFMNSWATAISNIRTAQAQGDAIDFVIVQEAWQRYPPSALRGQEPVFPKPTESTVVRAVELNMLRYIAMDFGPRIRDLENQIRITGGSASLYNQLGLLYVRAGMYDEARRAFNNAVNRGSLTAMINNGNIDLLHRDYEAARIWFNRVLVREPHNVVALDGLTRIDARFDSRGDP